MQTRCLSKKKRPLVRGPLHEPSFSNNFNITRLHICLHPMVLFFKYSMLLDLLSHCAGSSPAFGTMDRKSHRKVAFLLQKLCLVLFGLGGRVRIGCVWVHLVRLIHIVTGVLWKPVIKGKDVAWLLHMLFI